MKIMLVCHRFPYPPARGGKIRPFHIIKHFQEQGHEVTVASHYRSSQEREEGTGLQQYCSKVLAEIVKPGVAKLRMVKNLATLEPSSMGYFYSARLQQRIREELESGGYDLIFVHCSSVAPYVKGLAEGVTRILDFGDMDSQKWLAYAKAHSFPMSLGYWLEGRKLRRAEEELARQFDLCTATTRAEIETLDSYGTGVASAWFPNGVNLEYFSDDGVAYDPDTISFVGRMDYYPNSQCMIEFCEQTLPLLRERRPGIKLTVIGADPIPAVLRLGNIEGVTVTGSVPDVRPFLRESALSVAPLAIARGTQNKILESLALGVPCVCSDVAAGGIDCVPGEHVLTANTPEEYARQILRVLDSAEERKRLARAGRARMETNHTWEASMRKLDTIVERTMAVPVG